MNAAQQDAIKLVRQILTEHFPASVVLALVDASDADEDLELRIDGGYFHCYGMLGYAHEHLDSMLDRNTAIERSEEGDEHDHQ